MFRPLENSERVHPLKFSQQNVLSQGEVLVLKLALMLQVTRSNLLNTDIRVSYYLQYVSVACVECIASECMCQHIL